MVAADRPMAVPGALQALPAAAAATAAASRGRSLWLAPFSPQIRDRR